MVISTNVISILYYLGAKISQNRAEKNDEFANVIDVLVKNDNSGAFKYVKKLFMNIFMSKNDQEFLYRSAKVLLRNENTSMIDTIIEQNESGFKGNIYLDWALCWTMLRNKYNNSALIFWMCGHNYHSKWYFEELNLIKSMENKSKKGTKPEWPICRRNSINMGKFILFHNE